MRFRILGPVSAERNGRPIGLGSPQQRFIFAVLALEVNRLVTLDRLVELTWPEPPRTATHAVQVCVSRLRSLLAAATRHDTEPVRLVWATSGYTLRADPQSIDVHQFRAGLVRARATADDSDRVRLLDEALGLWRGPALAGTGSPEGGALLCAGLEEARLVAAEDRIDALLRLGRHREVIDDLLDLVAARPARERLVGQLMLALYRCGRTGDALAAYREARRRLADELGLEPGADLRSLEVAVLRDDPRLAAPVRDGAALAPADAPLSSVVHQTSHTRPIRVVLVDDHPIFRSGMRTALETGTEVTVVAEAGGVADAVAAVSDTAPDVVVMDLCLPDGSGADATKRILGGHPACAVLVMSMSDTDEAIVSALRSGARGYLLKYASRDETLAAVRTVAGGGSVFSPQVAARLAAMTPA
jgi:DNA-binding SARP family transcriptional activator/CheY-like chemotaxis protein